MDLCIFRLLVLISVLCVSREQTTTPTYDLNNYYGDDYNYDDYYYDYDYYYGDYYYDDYDNYTDGDYNYDDDYNYAYDNFTYGNYYYYDSYYYSDDYLYNDYNYTNSKRGVRLLDDEFCSRYYYSCNSTLRYCMCDTSCDVFKDCCRDADVSNGNTTAEKLKEVFPYADCVYLPEVHSRWFIFVINTCPYSTEKILKDLCENVDIKNVISSTPVFGNTTNLLYRNMYCAICHNEHYTSLNPQLSCGWRREYKGNFKLNKLLKLDACSIEYTIATDYNISYTNPIRECYSTISECSNPSADGIHKKECHPGRNEYVFTTDNIYTNKHCYFCSNENGEDVSCNVLIYNFSLRVGKTSYAYSYRMLFDLESGRVQSEKRFDRLPRENNAFFISSRSECSDTQIFDPFASVCRDVTCTPSAGLIGLKCSDVIRNISKNGSCATIGFNEGEYVILNETSIFIFNSSKTYHDVVFDGNVALVCITAHTLTNLLYRNDPIEGWLSIVCGLVSVVFLCITTLVYTLPKLQNQPGRLLLCLSISLCLAQLLFFVARRSEIDNILCKTVGILVHFFFLASFLWMNVISFDVYSTFSASFRNAKNNRKRFAFYSLYVWLFSIIIISIGILVDETTSWTYSPKYGEGACWITNTKGLIAFLLVPLAVLILLNSVFFALSVRSIFVTKRKSSELLQTRSNCDILIYVKLSTIMGLTWMFGYVATLVQNQVFWDPVCHFQWLTRAVHILLLCFEQKGLLICNRIFLCASAYCQ